MNWGRKRSCFRILDEFTVAYRSRELFYTREIVYRPGPLTTPFGNVIVIAGQVVGIWKRSVVKERLRIEARWFNPPGRREEAVFTDAAERYAAFMGLPVDNLDVAAEGCS